MPHGFDPRLAPIHRLRNETALLLAEAERSLALADGSQTPASVAAIKRQLDRFDTVLASSHRALLRAQDPHGHVLRTSRP